MRASKCGVLPLLGATAALIGLMAAGPAVAADDDARIPATERMTALMERLTVEQREAVERFEAWIAARGTARITGETTDGRRVGKLGGEGLQTMVTRRNADGTFSTRCVDSAEQYALFLLGELESSSAQGVRQATE